MVGELIKVNRNSATVYPTGVARSGANRTRAQREAAARNLLHQPGQVAVEDAEASSVPARPQRTGYLSKAARVKIRAAVDALIELSLLPEAKSKTMNEKLGYKQQACYPTMATFTLPSEQRVDAAGNFDDRAVKREVWAPMVQELRSRFGVKAYLWVAEDQENGNIHFHCLIDKYIDNTEAGGNLLTRTWNRLLDNAGYIAPYTAKMKARYTGGFVYDPQMTDLVEVRQGGGTFGVQPCVVDYATQVERWASGEATGWTQPNSVDVHKIARVNSVAGYICKYLTKHTGAEKDGRQPRPIQGAVWGCADELRPVKAYTEPMTDEMRVALCNLQDSGEKAVSIRLITDIGSMTPAEFEDNELAGQVVVRATVYSFNRTAFWQHAPPDFRQRHRTYYRALFRHIYGNWVTMPVQAPPDIEREAEQELVEAARAG